MIITLDPGSTNEQIIAIEKKLGTFGYEANHIKTQKAHYIVGIGKQLFDIRYLGQLEGVQDVHRVSDAYKMVSRKWKARPTGVTLDTGFVINEGGFTIMAGPCSIENEEQVRETAEFLKSSGVAIMRGGAFKPRTSPYSFQGLGIEGLKMFFSVAREHGLAIVSEVVAASHIEEMYDYIDIFQVGTRNSQNFDLLHELGKVDKPVLLKRAMSGTLDELLQSAEYIFSKGNERILLCERGIRTFEKSYRNTLDLNAIPVLKEKSHLPVIVDPSHGIGIRQYVEPMALAGIMAGADGMIVEIHKTPDKAYSDAVQTLGFPRSTELFSKARQVFELRSGFYDHHASYDIVFIPLSPYTSHTPRTPTHTLNDKCPR